METILNCLQIWASKILQRFFVGWALPSNTSNTNFGLSVAPLVRWKRNAGFWIQSLCFKTVPAMSNKTTYVAQTLIVAVSIINHLALAIALRNTS